MESTSEPPAPPQRLVSLDVLRGFDMFWILGMEEVAVALGKATNNTWVQGVAHQLDHAPWAGFHCLDLVFPLFIFAAGVSLVFSLTRAVEKAGRPAALRKALVRALILFTLGIFCYGGISNGLDGIRWLGVLQRIALCGLGGAVAFLFLRTRGLIALTVALLAGYWALMTFVPVPGPDGVAVPGTLEPASLVAPFPGGGSGEVARIYQEGRNLANWMDMQFLPGKKWDVTHDPEGLLSTLPALATALLGVLTGIFVRNSTASTWRKAATLLLAGTVLAGAGWLWHPHFPIIKKLWTSSFVLVTAGYSMVLLAAFMALIDGAGWKKWATPFIWIGMNPITLYLTHQGVMNYGDIAERIGGGPLSAAMGSWGPVWLASLVVAQSLLLAWFLHHRKIFLRV